LFLHLASQLGCHSIAGIRRGCVLRDEAGFLSKAAVIVNIRTLTADFLRVARHVHATISAYLFIVMPHCGTKNAASRSSLDLVDGESMKVELSSRYRLWMCALAPMTLGVGTAVLWLRSRHWPLLLCAEGLILRCGERVKWTSIAKISVRRDYLDDHINQIELHHHGTVIKIPVGGLVDGEGVAEIILTAFKHARHLKGSNEMPHGKSGQRGMAQPEERLSVRCIREHEVFRKSPAIDHGGHGGDFSSSTVIASTTASDRRRADSRLGNRTRLGHLVNG
jgi:hypothetical protein